MKCIKCNINEAQELFAKCNECFLQELQHTTVDICHPKEDIINTPNHYTQGGIEPIDFSISNNLNFCEGNVIKYVTRYKHKNGLEDLKKARFYIDKLIDGLGENK